MTANQNSVKRIFLVIIENWLFLGLNFVVEIDNWNFEYFCSGRMLR